MAKKTTEKLTAIGRCVLIQSAAAVLFTLLIWGSALGGSNPGRVRVALTGQEKAWLQAHPRLRVGGPRAFAPFHYFDGNGKAMGIGAEVVDSLLKSLGISPDYKGGLPWDQVLERIERRDLDLVACVAKTKDRERFLLFSKAYTSNPLVIVSRMDAPFIGGLEDLHGKRIALVKGISTRDWLVQDGIRFVPVEVSALPEALEAVSAGRADASIDNLAAATFLIKKKGLHNLKVAAPTAWGNYELFIGVRRDWPELKTILDKTLGAMPSETLAAIRDKWISQTVEENLHWADILKWIVLVFFPAAGLVGLFVAQNRRLRKEVHERRKSEKLYRLLFESANDAIFLMQDDRFVECNQKTLEMFGCTREQIIGQRPVDFSPPIQPDGGSSRDRVLEKMSLVMEGQPQFFEWSHVKYDKKPFLAQVSLNRIQLDSRIYVQAIVRDITHLKQVEEHSRKLETRLRQAQKMEAIGTFAGGIAHDFNNILSAIIGFTELAAMDIDAEAPAATRLRQSLKACERAKGVVHQILSFSRHAKQEEKPMFMGPVIKECLKLLRVSIPTTVDIRDDIAKETGTVMADPTQIHQVIMNLCTNAAHAMRENGGMLSIGLEEIFLDEDDIEPPYELTAGQYVRLKVKDTGHGIQQQLMERIFEPYFTTKEMDVGTGLGLSVVHGIVKRHGGAIHVCSKPGGGTTFTIYWPQVKSEAVEESESNAAPPMGHERILFVDDEPFMVEVGQQMLERLGYHVTARMSSLEALEVFRHRPHSFDLVITDQTMPGMTGGRLASELIAIRSDIPIILCTGFSEIMDEQKASALGIQAFVFKPFVFADLAGTVRSVLDGKDGMPPKA